MKFNKILNLNFFKKKIKDVISSKYLFVTLFSLIILIIIFITFLISYKNIIEAFGGSKSSDAFNIPSLHLFTFQTPILF